MSAAGVAPWSAGPWSSAAALARWSAWQPVGRLSAAGVARVGGGVGRRGWGVCRRWRWWCVVVGLGRRGGFDGRGVGVRHEPEPESQTSGHEGRDHPDEDSQSFGHLTSFEIVWGGCRVIAAAISGFGTSLRWKRHKSSFGVIEELIDDDEKALSTRRGVCTMSDPPRLDPRSSPPPSSRPHRIRPSGHPRAACSGSSRPWCWWRRRPASAWPCSRHRRPKLSDATKATTGHPGLRARRRSGRLAGSRQRHRRRPGPGSPSRPGSEPCPRLLGSVSSMAIRAR